MGVIDGQDFVEDVDDHAGGDCPSLEDYDLGLVAGILGGEHPDTRATRAGLADAYRAVGHDKDAAAPVRARRRRRRAITGPYDHLGGRTRG